MGRAIVLGNVTKVLNMTWRCTSPQRMPSGGSIHGSQASCDQDAGTALPPGAAVQRIRARCGSALREAVLQIAQAGAGGPPSALPFEPFSHNGASGPCEEGGPEPSLLDKAGCCSSFVEHEAAASWSILEESDGDAGGSGADIACALVPQAIGEAVEPKRERGH